MGIWCTQEAKGLILVAISREGIASDLFGYPL